MGVGRGVAVGVTVAIGAASGVDVDTDLGVGRGVAVGVGVGLAAGTLEDELADVLVGLSGEVVAAETSDVVGVGSSAGTRTDGVGLSVSSDVGVAVGGFGVNGSGVASCILSIGAVVESD